MSSSAALSPVPRRSPAFATTHWSVVLQASRPDSPEASAALSLLCQRYWFPLYAHVRRSGHAIHDAQDLTQGFFARLLEHDLLARADPARGRFRSFVLTALKNFLADEHAKAQAQKRGGGVAAVALDVDDAERRLQGAMADPAAPDKAFDREWALAMLGAVLQRLEEEHRAAGKGRSFDVLKPALIGARDAQPYAQLAAQLGIAEGAVKVAVHRLRRRYRELLESEIAQTVATPAEAEAERQCLLRVLAEA